MFGNLVYNIRYRIFGGLHRMKRYIILAALLLLVSLSLSSCAAPVCATLLTGGEGGTYYGLGLALSDLLSSDKDEDGDKVEGKFTASFNVETSSGYKENIEKLIKNEAQLAIVRNDIAYYAMNGTKVFEGNKKEGFSLVGELYNECIHIIAQIGTGSLQNLNGKTICVGPKGSADEAAALAVIDAAYIEGCTVVNLSIDDAISAFKNREIDAYIFVSGIQSRTVTALSEEYTFELLGIEDTVLETLLTEYPFFSPYTISKRTYSVMKNALSTVTLRACLIANEKIDKDLVYNITKRFAEDSALLEHAKHKELSVETMWMNACIPLHDGAEKYKKEYEKMLEEAEKNKYENGTDSSQDSGTAAP